MAISKITSNAIDATGFNLDSDTLTIDATNNRVGVGTVSPSAALDIAYGDYQNSGAIKIGADLGQNTSRTDASRKFGAITAAHFDNDEADLGLISMDSSSNSASTLTIGGGSSSFNSASALIFQTSSDGASAGTERMRITSTGVLQTSSTLASYHYTTWNPSDTSGTATNAPATGTTKDSNFVTIVNSSGTLTITFDVAGNYFVCLTQQTNHAQVFTFDRQIAYLGGTATREITRNPNNSGVPSIDSNFSVSTGFYVSATASQTLTILPTYELTGSGSTTSHAADFNVTIQYCGG